MDVKIFKDADPKFLALCEALSPHVEAQARSQAPPYGFTDDQWREHEEEVVVFTAKGWLMMLLAAVDAQERPLDAASLDADLLPTVFSPVQLDVIVTRSSNGRVDAEALRAILRRYKATLPADTGLLPDPMPELMRAIEAELAKNAGPRS